MLLHVHLFGHLEIVYKGEHLPEPESRKAQELLSYLLMYRHRRHPREYLADVLWGDHSNGQPCRSYLRKALWQIQKALTPYHSQVEASLLLADIDSIQINPDAALDCDVAILDETYARVRGIPGAELDGKQQNALREAVRLYRGELLEGWYENWCLYERERLHHIFVILIDKLMSSCEAHGWWEDGVTYGDLILRHEPAHERTHRRLMRLYYQMQDRTSALRQYQRCVAALHRELSIEPARRTVALYEQIRDDRPLNSQLAVRTLPDRTLAETLAQLQQIQELLAATQVEILQNIEAVQHSLTMPR